MQAKLRRIVRAGSWKGRRICKCWLKERQARLRRICKNRFKETEARLSLPFQEPALTNPFVSSLLFPELALTTLSAFP